MNCSDECVHLVMYINLVEECLLEFGLNVMQLDLLCCAGIPVNTKALCVQVHTLFLGCVYIDFEYSACSV